jgi:adenylate cyclase
MTHLRSNLLTAVFGMVVALLLFGASRTVAYRPFLRLQNAVEDSRFFIRNRLFPDPDATDSIVIVDIDDRSLDNLGDFNRWRRRQFVRLLQALTEEQPRAIFLDALLLEGGSLIDNRYLANTVRHAGNVIAGFYFDLDAESAVHRPVDSVRSRFPILSRLSGESSAPELLSADSITYSYHELVMSSVRTGFTNYIPDPDGVVRHIPLFVDYNGLPFPAVPLQMWLFLNKMSHTAMERVPGGVRFDGTRVPTDNHCFMRIDYPATRRIYPAYSFVDVQQRRFEPGTFTDKIVMIGASAPRLGDLKRIPGFSELPGVEVHAAALSTLLAGRFINVLSGEILLIWMLVLGAGTAVMFERMRYRTGIAVALATPVVLNIAGIYAFIVHRLFINIVVPSFLVLLLAVAIIVHRLVEHID